MAPERTCAFCTEKNLLSEAKSRLYFTLIKEDNFTGLNLNSEQLNELLDSKCLCIKCAYVTERVTDLLDTFKTLEDSVNITIKGLKKRCSFCSIYVENVFSYEIIGKKFQEQVTKLTKQITKRKHCSTLLKGKKFCINCCFFIGAWNDINEAIDRLKKQDSDENMSQGAGTSNKHQKMNLQTTRKSKRKLSEVLVYDLSNNKKLRKSSESYSVDSKKSEKNMTSIRKETKSDNNTLATFNSWNEASRKRKYFVSITQEELNDKLKHLITVKSESLQRDVNLNDKVTEDRKMMCDIPYIYLNREECNASNKANAQNYKSEKGKSSYVSRASKRLAKRSEIIFQNEFPIVISDSSDESPRKIKSPESLPVKNERKTRGTKSEEDKSSKKSTKTKRASKRKYIEHKKMTKKSKVNKKPTSAVKKQKSDVEKHNSDSEKYNSDSDNHCSDIETRSLNNHDSDSGKSDIEKKDDSADSGVGKQDPIVKEEDSESKKHESDSKKYNSDREENTDDADKHGSDADSSEVEKKDDECSKSTDKEINNMSVTHHKLRKSSRTMRSGKDSSDESLLNTTEENSGVHKDCSVDVDCVDDDKDSSVAANNDTKDETKTTSKSFEVKKNPESRQKNEPKDVDMESENHVEKNGDVKNKKERHMPKIKFRYFPKESTAPRVERQCSICKNILKTKCDKIIHEYEHNIPFSPQIILDNSLVDEKLEETKRVSKRKNVGKNKVNNNGSESDSGKEKIETSSNNETDNTAFDDLKDSLVDEKLEETKRVSKIKNVGKNKINNNGSESDSGKEKIETSSNKETDNTAFDDLKEVNSSSVDNDENKTLSDLHQNELEKPTVEEKQPEKSDNDEIETSSDKETVNISDELKVVSSVENDVENDVEKLAIEEKYDDLLDTSNKDVTEKLDDVSRKCVEDNSEKRLKNILVEKKEENNSQNSETTSQKHEEESRLSEDKVKKTEVLAEKSENKSKEIEVIITESKGMSKKSGDETEISGIITENAEITKESKEEKKESDDEPDKSEVVSENTGSAKKIKEKPEKSNVEVEISNNAKSVKESDISEVEVEISGVVVENIEKTETSKQISEKSEIITENNKETELKKSENKPEKNECMVENVIQIKFDKSEKTDDRLETLEIPKKSSKECTSSMKNEDLDPKSTLEKSENQSIDLKEVKEKSDSGTLLRTPTKSEKKKLDEPCTSKNVSDTSVMKSKNVKSKESNSKKKVLPETNVNRQEDEDDEKILDDLIRKYTEDKSYCDTKNHDKNTEMKKNISKKHCKEIEIPSFEHISSELELSKGYDKVNKTYKEISSDVSSNDKVITEIDQGKKQKSQETTSVVSNSISQGTKEQLPEDEIVSQEDDDSQKMHLQLSASPENQIKSTEKDADEDVEKTPPIFVTVEKMLEKLDA